MALRSLTVLSQDECGLTAYRIASAHYKKADGTEGKIHGGTERTAM